MSDTKYLVFPNTADDVHLPTRPEPMPLSEVGIHISAWLMRYEKQGYFSNCNQQRIPLAAISFTIEPTPL